MAAPKGPQAYTKATFITVLAAAPIKIVFPNAFDSFAAEKIPPKS